MFLVNVEINIFNHNILFHQPVRAFERGMQEKSKEGY
jgi:hypothetical protein